MKRQFIKVWTNEISGRADGLFTQLDRSMIEPHEQQAIKNHNQDLDTLASRGGLAVCEAVAILEDRRWTAMATNTAIKRLEELLKQERLKELLKHD